MTRWDVSYGKYNIVVEVEKIKGWHTKYDGYAFCPIDDCVRSSDAFIAMSCLTESRAKSQALAKVKNHLRKSHK